MSDGSGNPVPRVFDDASLLFLNLSPKNGVFCENAALLLNVLYCVAVAVYRARQGVPDQGGF